MGREPLPLGLWGSGSFCFWGVILEFFGGLGIVSWVNFDFIDLVRREIRETRLRAGFP